MSSFSDFVTNFGRGLDVLSNTYQNQGLGAAAGQLYGAAGQNLKTGAGLGQTPEETAAALQNLGLNRNVALAIGGGVNAAADFLNPLGQVGGAAVGGAIGDALGVSKTAKDAALGYRAAKYGAHAADDFAKLPLTPLLAKNGGQIAADVLPRVPIPTPPLRVAVPQAVNQFIASDAGGAINTGLNAGGEGMKALADKVGYVRNVDPVAQTMGDASGLTPQEAADTAARMIRRADPTRAVHGSMGPKPAWMGMAGGEYAGADPLTELHERILHGGLGIAQQRGATDALDWSGRFVNMLQNSPTRTGQALGIIGDEARAWGGEAAKAAQNTGAGPIRQTWEGLKGAAHFLDRPAPSYIDQFSNASTRLNGTPYLSGAGDLAGQIYGSQAPLNAVRAAMIGGAGTGAYGVSRPAFDYLNQQ